MTAFTEATAAVNQTTFPVSEVEQSIVQRFERQVAQHGSRPAVIDKQRELTYDALNRAANEIAHALARVTGPEPTRVAIYMDKGGAYLAAIFAVLKAGHAYVPLDPAFPRDRNLFIVEDAAAPVVLTSAAHAVALRELVGSAATIIDVDALAPAPGDEQNLALTISPDALAYLIYTSGSTGRPKGVMQNHRNTLHGCMRRTNLQRIVPDDRMTLFYSCSVMGSVYCIFGALLNGASLFPYDFREEGLVDFAPWLVSRKITIFHSVASVFRQFANGFDGQITGASVRLVIFGGERVFVSDVAAARRVFSPDVTFFTGLGSTETGTIRHFSIGPDTRLDARVVPIGYPVEGVEIVLTGPDGAVLGEREVGEINVRSRYLALGYWNNEEATRRAFSVVDPGSGVRNYRMGDLAELLPGGLLEHRGRKDFQVKIRGFRVEVGEVDAALQSHPGVREGAVKAQEIGNDTQLVAYVVPRAAASDARPLSARELREFLRSKLPSYMVPAIFVGLEALPRTPNGKVDAASLPLPLPSNELSGERRLAPETATQRALVEICVALLGRPSIGINENFFDIGGDSLSATKLVARIHKDLGVKLSMRAVFSAPDLEALASVLDAAERAPVDAGPGLTLTTLTRVPATPAQRRMWLVEQLHPGTAAYNISNAVRLRGALDVGALELALNAVVARHGSLRTCFESDGEVLWQLERPHLAFALPRTDLSSLDPSAREELCLRLVREHAATSLDLAQGPLFICHLLVLGADDHVLSLSFNHIIYDNIWSSRVFFQDLGALYQAFREQASPALEPLELRFLDYAAWEQARIEGGNFGEHLAYWRKQLAQMPAALELPSDHQRPAEPSFRGGQIAFKVPAELRLALLSFNRRHSVTVFMSLLATWQLLLHRYSGQDDLAVGTPTGRRYRSETEAMIGLFINNLVLRARFLDGLTFEQLIEQVRQTCIEAFEHDDVPFEALVAELAPVRSAGAPPFFRHFFIHRNATQGGWALPGLELEPVAAHHGTSKFDLTLSILETEHELSGTLEYSADLFERESMERLIQNYLTLLAGALAAPTLAIARLGVVSEAEHELAVNAHNRTRATYPVELCVTGLFKLQVGVQPEAVAVVASDRTLSYRDLDDAAERMADKLRALGVGRDVLVGVCLQRSARLLVSLLAVLKAGGAYVPLDPEYPAERLSSMLEDSQARVLISESGAIERFSEPRAAVLLFNELPEMATAVRSKREPVTPAPDDLAYVIYTSGSTGKPKGVQVTHRGLTNFLCAMQRQPGITSADVVQAITTVCFDIAALELFLPLIAGARVIIGDREVSLSPAALEKSLREHQATILQATPVTWRMLLDSGWDGTPKLKVLCGGEAMGADLAERLLRTGSEVWNMYGPTETTVWSSVGRIQHKDDARFVGVPIANTQLVVTNAALAIQPIGVPGELMIGGDGLARGYLGRPDLTAERFVASPLGSTGRLYRTGDVAVRRADGAIEFFGRADHQVKIRGFRVELGEIEAQLATHPGVRQAVVVAREDVPGDKRLIAYHLPAGTSPVPSDVLHAHLKAVLPHYMIPSAFVALDQLPLTANGKIDRKRLPAPPEAQETAAPAASPGDGGARDDLDRSFLGVWSAILRRNDVTIDDDFFALGGDSMMAIRLVKELKRATGIDYPLSTLFSSPTIRQLVARVGEAAERAASVVQLNSVRAGVPIYCLAGVQLYKELAERFVDAPVFGVYAKRELAGIQAQDAGEVLEVPLDSLTQTYADAIARHATQKHVVLVGLSFGGLMALEVAAELNRRGFEITEVAMFDSIPAGAYVRSLRKAVADCVRRVAEGRGKETVKDLLERAYGRVAASLPRVLAQLPERGRGRRESVQGQAFRKMTASYDPTGKTYALNALLIKATQKTFGIGASLRHDYGFGRIIAGRLEITEVQADHRGLLDGAAVSQVYESLSAFLEGSDPLSRVVSITPFVEQRQARNSLQQGDARGGQAPASAELPRRQSGS